MMTSSTVPYDASCESRLIIPNSPSPELSCDRHPQTKMLERLIAKPLRRSPYDRFQSTLRLIDRSTLTQVQLAWKATYSIRSSFHLSPAPDRCDLRACGPCLKYYNLR